MSDLDHIWVDCSCYSFNHAIRVFVDKDEEAAWIEVRLNRYQPLYKRIWIAFVYVLGFDCEDQEYDVTILDKSQIERVVSLLNTAVEGSSNE